MYLFNFIAFLLYIIIPLFFNTHALANTLYSDKNVPIKVNSNDMVYSLDKNTVIFTGNVIVVRGEFVMTSDRMKVFITDSKKDAKVSTQASDTTASSNKIDRIEAYGNVEFDYGTQSGSSENAVYEAKISLLTLNGNPIVRDNDNFIKGTVIKYYMNERRSEVVGTKNKQVEAVFGTN